MLINLLCSIWIKYHKKLFYRRASQFKIKNLKLFIFEFRIWNYLVISYEFIIFNLIFIYFLFYYSPKFFVKLYNLMRHDDEANIVLIVEHRIGEGWFSILSHCHK